MAGEWLLVDPDDRIFMQHFSAILGRFPFFYHIPTNTFCLFFVYFLFYLIAAYSYILLSYSALLPHSFGFCNPTCPWPLLHHMASFQLQVSWLSTSLSPCFPIQFPEGENLMDQTHLFHSGPGFLEGQP